MEMASSPCFNHTMTMNSASGMLVSHEPRTIALRFGSSGGLTLSACSRVSGNVRQVIHIRLQVTRDGVITEVETGRVFASFRQMLADNDFRPCMSNPNHTGVIADVCRQWATIQ